MPDMTQGLLPPNPQMQQQPAPGPAGTPAAAPTAPGVGTTPAAPQPAPGTPPAAPRQQRDYNANPLGEADKLEFEKFIVSAQKLIHSPQTRDTVLKRIGVSEQGPIGDISDTVILITDRIDQQMMKDQGKPVDDAVKIQGANVVTGQIIEIAESAGKIPKMSDDEKAVAYTYAVQKYTDRMIARGEITRGELQQYAQQATAAGEKAGQLNPGRMKSAMNTPAASASSPAPAQDPMRPTETMSQKLAKGGLLDA